MKIKEDNPAAFKHFINPKVVQQIGRAIKKAWPEFNERKFNQASKYLAPLELKHRVHFIRKTLAENLPADYLKALSILLKSLNHDPALKGFSLWPHTEFVQTYGLKHFNESMQALCILTSKFTAEFAVRPFLLQEPDRTFGYLLNLAEHKDHHIRRWTSEGTRPRLPWGIRLQDSVKNPSKGLEILEKLKFDEELYVRKSVANHLNDIAKDHPAVVVQTLRKWQKETPSEHQEKIQWIKRQALRTLIKKGYNPALKLMGYAQKPEIKIESLSLKKKQFKPNEVLAFEFQLQSKMTKTQRLAIDYIIHYQKAAGRTSPKVFKLKVIELKGQAKIKIQKNHSLRPVTTRKDYPGEHKLEIQINGKIVASTKWRLVLKP